MKSCVLKCAIACVALVITSAQAPMPREAESHITVLVDLSGTWLNERSKAANKLELEGVAQAISALAVSIKSPIQIDYLEIGDGSLARRPICSGSFSPSIFPSKGRSEFSDVKKLLEYFGEDCTRLILMRKPAAFTDISGALDTVSRQMVLQKPGTNIVLLLSDLKEERRQKQPGQIGSLKGVHAILLYRVLDEDRFNPAGLDARIANWKGRIGKAGAKVFALDDISAQPAQIKRLALQ